MYVILQILIFYFYKITNLLFRINYRFRNINNFYFIIINMITVNLLDDTKFKVQNCFL